MLVLTECFDCYFGLLNIAPSLALRTTLQSKRSNTTRNCASYTQEKSEEDTQVFGQVRSWAQAKNVPKMLVIGRGKRTSNCTELGVPRALNYQS